MTDKRTWLPRWFGRNEAAVEAASDEAVLPFDVHTGAGELAEAPRAPVVLQTVARIMGAAALVAVVLAVVANLAWGPLRPASQAGYASIVATGTQYQPDLHLAKPAVDLLPVQIVGYETIGRHSVPGAGDRSGEALFATYNMELDVQVPISIYARVDGYASETEAAAALRGLMATYPAGAAPQKLGLTQATTGYSTDRAVWMVAWTRGQYLVSIKTAFKDKPPVEKRQFLKNLGLPVAEAIDSFQRTGKQGLSL